MSATTLPLASTAAESAIARGLRIFLSETRYELTRSLRTRTFSLSAIGFPVMFYLLFGIMMNRHETVGAVPVARYLLGSYATFGVVGSALFGIGVGLAADLSAGWLELKRASPMPPAAYLAAKCVTAICFGAIILTLLTLLGATMGNAHLSLSEYLRLLALVAAGAIPFACMGLALALLVPFNSAPGVTNLIYLPMSFMGGLWMPLQFLPRAVQHMAPLLPTYHLAQLMLGVFGAQDRSHTALSHWMGLLGFTMLMFGVAWIAFRRREQNA